MLLPENLADFVTRSRQQHKADHAELDRLHNLVDVGQAPGVSDAVSLEDDQTIDGIKTPVADWFFSSGRPWVDAGSPAFGARNSAGQVRASAVRAAVAIASLMGDALFLSPGDYIMDSFATGTTIFAPLTKGLTIFAIPGTATVINDPSIVAWRTVFGTEAHSTIDLTGLHVDGITFDGQSSLNPSMSANAGQSRYVVSAYKGENVTVTNSWFKNHTGRNVVSIVGAFAANVLDHITMTGCLFTNIGTPNFWHDHSTAYLDGNRVTHCGNTYVGCSHADGQVSTAYSSYEVHGQSLTSDGNRTYNYASMGLLVSSRFGDIGGLPQSMHAKGNIAYNVGGGLGIYPIHASGMTDVSITASDIVIAPNQWPGTAIDTGDPLTSWPGCAHAAFTASFTTIATKRFSLKGNQVRWLAQTATPRVFDCFYLLQRYLRIPTLDIGHIIEGNEITDCPVSPIRLEQVLTADGFQVRNNTVRNLGKKAIGRSGQALVSIGRQTWATGAVRPTGLKGLEVKGNTVVDDQGAHTLMNLVAVDDPVAHTVAATTNGTNLVTFTGTAHDLGSFIDHPDLPANTYIVNGTVTPPGGNVGWDFSVAQVSAAATGSSTATATVTTRPPTTADCEVADNTIRVDDGATITPLYLQSGESMFFRGRAPIPPVAGTGATDVGSTVVDRATGAVYRQTASPSGSTWVAVGGLTGSPLTEVAITGATVLTATAFGQMHACSGTTTDYPVTLPAVAGNAGKVISLRMVRTLTKLVTLTGNAAELIDGSNTRIMWAGESAVLECDGTGWQKVAGKTIPMKATIRRTAVQSLVNNVVTTIDFTSTLVDNTARMADLTADTIVIVRPGGYLLSGRVGVFTTLIANASRIICQIMLNGAGVWQTELSALTGAIPTAALATTTDLVAGNLISLSFFQNSGTDNNTGTGAATLPTLNVVEMPTW